MWMRCRHPTHQELHTLVCDKTARGSMVRNAHLERKEAAVSCGIILVPVSVARSMGLTVCWGVLRWVLSSRDGDRRC